MLCNLNYLRSFAIYFTEITLREKEHKESYVTTNKADPQPETVNILKKKLQYEIEFYEWLKTRFYAGLNSFSWHEASIENIKEWMITLVTQSHLALVESNLA